MIKVLVLGASGVQNEVLVMIFCNEQQQMM